MAAYAALVSLMNTMEQIKNHPRLSTSLEKKQIESLQEKAGLLLEFIERYNSQGGSREAQDLESQIASAAHTAEDVIESHIADQILAGSNEESTISLLDLQKVIRDMDSIKEKVMEAKEKWGFKEEQLTYSMPATSSRPLTTGKTTMVGFDDELIQLMDVLTGQQSSRRIISIVGMGGMGKTTLARNVYENLLIMHHFDIRAWATISQENSLREILLELLSSKGKSITETVDGIGEQLYKRLSKEDVDKLGEQLLKRLSSADVDELGEYIYKSLSGRRYLIVLDDVWSTKVWNKIKVFFPDNGNGSRVVLTTRLLDVAIHCCSYCLRMNFLDEDKSWSLFQERVFGHEGCSPELEKIGKKIAKLCKGLPLSIAVIGGLLQKSSMTKRYWQNVAKNINSIVSSGENEQVLCLSYSHLPAHLKPCFLYMGIFQEGRAILVSEIIQLWVAKGFLKSDDSQMLEEVANDYLMDLIDRNLILACGRGPNGEIETCQIHDLLRDVCLRVAKKEKFFGVIREHVIPRGVDREDRHGFHQLIKNEVNYHLSKAWHLASLARSPLCGAVGLPVKSRLLRVLNTVGNCSLEETFQNFNLRLLSYKTLSVYMLKLPSSVALIWNLQTLIIRGVPELIDAPFEIWKMPQLRHIECHRIYLPDPPPSDQQDDLVVLGNLQSLKRVVNFRWNKEACRRIPNIKELHMQYCELSKGYDYRLYYHLPNLGHLYKLESLVMEFSSGMFFNVMKNLTFPRSLNKLSLTNSRLQWEDLTMIGSLPHLEVLELERHSVRRGNWSCVNGEFLRLKFLKIYFCGLETWTADSSHFPVLEKLVLGGLQYLNEIPWGIGEIPTLKLIRLDWCSVRSVVSAMKMKEEQENLGNDGPRILVYTNRQDSKILREEAETEELSINNIQLWVIENNLLTKNLNSVAARRRARVAFWTGWLCFILFTILLILLSEKSVQPQKVQNYQLSYDSAN